MLKLKEALERENITQAAMIPFRQEYIINRPKYDRIFYDFGTPESVLAIAVPYRFYNGRSNISKYAHARDYHLYFKELSARLSEFNLLGFADTSPFDERQIAYDAHLGVKGANGLLINPTYGSYVFIGVFFSKNGVDPELEVIPLEDRNCLMCGACAKACPSKENCLSGLTQKKKLTQEEVELVKKSPLIWGCDICQDVCPMNKNALTTPIPFFCENIIPYLDDNILNELENSDETEKRAWSWRGLEVVRRQIRLINGADH